MEHSLSYQDLLSIKNTLSKLTLEIWLSPLCPKGMFIRLDPQANALYNTLCLLPNNGTGNRMIWFMNEDDYTLLLADDQKIFQRAGMKVFSSKGILLNRDCAEENA